MGLLQFCCAIFRLLCYPPIGVVICKTKFSKCNLLNPILIFPLHAHIVYIFLQQSSVVWIYYKPGPVEKRVDFSILLSFWAVYFYSFFPKSSVEKWNSKWLKYSVYLTFTAIYVLIAVTMDKCLSCSESAGSFRNLIIILLLVYF
jgi:hypothetical protein